MLDCSKDEVASLVDRFMVLGARWGLDSVQVAALLGVSADIEVMFDEGDLVWVLRRGGCDAERRMRLLVDVDGMLVRLVPNSRDIAVWLRSPVVGYIDEMVTPLAAMSSGAAAIRALRDYLAEMSDGGSLTS
jgi:hypothetical protein